jgi:hypothetical protein
LKLKCEKLERENEVDKKEERQWLYSLFLLGIEARNGKKRKKVYSITP